MSNEIINLDRAVSSLEPLGLPAGYSIRLTSAETSRVLFLYLYREGAGRVKAVRIEIPQNARFEVILSKVRQNAVNMFNEYLCEMKDSKLLKSIEDRLNASRGMLVLESSLADLEDG